MIEMEISFMVGSKVSTVGLITSRSSLTDCTLTWLVRRPQLRILGMSLDPLTEVKIVSNIRLPKTGRTVGRGELQSVLSK